MDPKLCVLLLFRLNILLKAADIYIFFFASEAFNRGPVFPLLEFYSICSYSIHVQLLMVTHPSANRGPSCLTSVILRELVFPTW